MRLALTLLLLAALAAATTWMLHHFNPEETQPRAPSHHPDYYLEGATMTQLDASGALQYRLLADRVTHHPDDDSTDLDAPRLTYYHAQQQPWHVTAQHGTVPSGGDLVHLRGDVVVTHPGAPGQAALKAFTPTLDVFIDKREALTDAPVRIVQGESHVTALGMLLDMQKDHMELKSDVKGIYVH